MLSALRSPLYAHIGVSSLSIRSAMSPKWCAHMCLELMINCYLGWRVLVVIQNIKRVLVLILKL